MTTCIVYLLSRLDGYNAILSTGEKRIDMSLHSIKNVTNVLKLPLIIFHEDLTEEWKQKIRNVYDNVTFETVNFQDNSLPFKKYKRPKGYMMMCRFFSGVMQNHEALKKYDSYIRFDDDSFLIEPFLSQDKFINTLNNSDYVYRSAFIENNSMETLFLFTKQFCYDNNLNFDNIVPTLKQRKVLKSNNIYSGIAPYNNFHFCKLSLWNHTIIKKYIDKIEEKNGCLLEGWYDANIHAMICFILIPLINLKCSAITNFGYRHNRHFSILNNINIVYKNNERFFPLE
jgi:hypothetical protein